MAVKVKPLFFSPDVSKHEEKVNTLKTQQISNEQMGTSKADGEKLMVSNTRRHSILLSFLFLMDLYLDIKADDVRSSKVVKMLFTHQQGILLLSVIILNSPQN